MVILTFKRVLAYLFTPKFSYKMSRRMKEKKKKNDYQPIKDSVQRERQYNLMTSPRAGREITIVSACGQETMIRLRGNAG